MLRRRLPILKWLPSYVRQGSRSLWISDVLAGLTVAALNVPQSMAYAMLAGLPPIYGLYTSIVPAFLYFLFGTSSVMNVGTFALTSLMLGSAVEHVLKVQLDQQLDQQPNIYETTTLQVSFLAGIIQFVFAVIGLGPWLKRIMTEDVIEGFTVASALHILTSQAGTCLGIKIPRNHGIFGLFQSWWDIIVNLHQIHVATLLYSLLSLSSIFVFQKYVPFTRLEILNLHRLEILRRRRLEMRRKMELTRPISLLDKLVIPDVLLALIFNTVLLSIFPSKFGLETLGDVPSGLPTFKFPTDGLDLILIQKHALIYWWSCLMKKKI